MSPSTPTNHGSLDPQNHQCWSTDFYARICPKKSIKTKLTTVFSCWVAPWCAGRAVAPPPGEQLSHCGPHRQCTAVGDAPYWDVTAGRIAACYLSPTAGEYQETPAQQHLHERQKVHDVSSLPPGFL